MLKMTEYSKYLNQTSCTSLVMLVASMCVFHINENISAAMYFFKGNLILKYVFFLFFFFNIVMKGEFFTT